MMRHHEKAFYQGLKTATRRLVAGYGSQEAAGALWGISGQAVEAVLSQRDEHANKFLDLSRVADLELISGLPIVTEYLAGLHGKVLVDMPTSGPREILPRVAAALKEQGDVIALLGDALKERKVSPEAWALWEPEIREAVNALSALLSCPPTGGQ